MEDRLQGWGQAGRDEVSCGEPFWAEGPGWSSVSSGQLFIPFLRVSVYEMTVSIMQITLLLIFPNDMFGRAVPIRFIGVGSMRGRLDSVSLEEDLWLLRAYCVL